MFIENPNGGHWNLLTLTHYRRDEKKGTLHLVFPVDGGNVKVTPDHPQYRQIEQHLLASKLGHDQPL